MSVTAAAVARRNTSLVTKSLKKVVECPFYGSLLYDKTAFTNLDFPVRYHIGIDIGTRVTGVTLLKQMSNFNLYVEYCDVVHTHENPCVNTKADAILHKLDELRSLPTRNNDSLQWHIAIEDCLVGFQSARFSTKGLTLLAQLNGIVKYSCLKMFDIQPVHLHPTTARTLVGVNARSDVDVKERVLDFVRELSLELDWRSIERKLAFGSTRDDYDRADSFVLALNSVLASRREFLNCSNLKADVMETCFEEFEQNVLNSGHNLNFIFDPRKGSKKRKVKVNTKQKRYNKPQRQEIESYFNYVYENSFNKWARKDAQKWTSTLKLAANKSSTSS